MNKFQCKFYSPWFAWVAYFLCSSSPLSVDTDQNTCILKHRSPLCFHRVSSNDPWLTTTSKLCGNLIAKKCAFICICHKQILGTGRREKCRLKDQITMIRVQWGKLKFRKRFCAPQQPRSAKSDASLWAHLGTNEKRRLQFPPGESEFWGNECVCVVRTGRSPPLHRNTSALQLRFSPIRERAHLRLRRAYRWLG